MIAALVRRTGAEREGDKHGKYPQAARRPAASALQGEDEPPDDLGCGHGV